MLTAIVACGKNFEIGVNNDMIWKISEDLAEFKNKTINKTVIMGKNTYYSLPENVRPLPNRQTIVICSDNEENKNKIKHSNVILCHDINEIIEKYENSDEEVFVCGGETIYNQLLSYCKKVHLTHIDDSYKEADTYFNINMEDWKPIVSYRYDTEIPFEITTYVRFYK